MIKLIVANMAGFPITKEPISGYWLLCYWLFTMYLPGNWN